MELESYLSLGKFLSFLMALSGYGWVLCDYASRRLCEALP
jgi:hypothetical protein